MTLNVMNLLRQFTYALVFTGWFLAGETAIRAGEQDKAAFEEIAAIECELAEWCLDKGLLEQAKQWNSSALAHHASHRAATALRDKIAVQMVQAAKTELEKNHYVNFTVREDPDGAHDSFPADVIEFFDKALKDLK